MPRTNNTDSAIDRTDVDSTTAEAVSYDPADVTKWDANKDPGNVNDALDQIAGNIGVGGAHNLLDGTIHPDTDVDDPTEGSIIHGNAIKQWDEKVIGGDTMLLFSDGTDLDWNFLRALLVDPAPDATLDYMMTYDSSAAKHKRVLLNTLLAANKKESRVTLFAEKSAVAI